MPYYDHMRITPPLTLTLSHPGARGEKGKVSPTQGRGEKKERSLPPRGEGIK